MKPPAAKAASLGTVSVVMARADWCPPWGEGVIFLMAPCISVSGRCWPMTPVLATSTLAGATPSLAAAAAAICVARRKPSSPVAALAQPLFTTTARVLLEGSLPCESSTGAAFTRLRVKTPAA